MSSAIRRTALSASTIAGVKALAEAAKAAGVSQFILVSSMGVTHPEHQLNAMLDNILEWKLKGEDAVRATGINYTIVRPGELTNEPGGQRGVRIMQGDPSSGEGTHLAQPTSPSVLVSAIGREDLYGKTFEIVGDHARPAHRVGQSLQRSAARCPLNRMHASTAAAGPASSRSVAPIEPREVPAVVAAFCLFFCVFARLFRGAPGARDDRHACSARDRVADLFVVTWIASLAHHPDLRLPGRASSAAACSCPGSTARSRVALVAVGLVLQADENNVAIGAVLLRLHQRAEPVHRVGVLELPARAVSPARRASACSASSPRAAPRVRSSGPFITDLAGRTDRQQRRAVPRRGSCSCWRSSSSVRCSRSGRRTSTAARRRRRPAPAAAAAARARGPADRRQSVRRLLAGAEVALPAGHRAVRRSCSPRSARSCTSSSCGWSRRPSRILRTARASSRASTGSCRPDGGLPGLPHGPHRFEARPHGAADHRAGRHDRRLPRARGAPARSWRWRSCIVAAPLRRVRVRASGAARCSSSRLDTETKYKAKSLIDVPVYRGADALVGTGAPRCIEHGGATPWPRSASSVRWSRRVGDQRLVARAGDATTRADCRTERRLRTRAGRPQPRRAITPRFRLAASRGSRARFARARTASITSSALAKRSSRDFASSRSSSG